MENLELDANAISRVIEGSASPADGKAMWEEVLRLEGDVGQRTALAWNLFCRLAFAGNVVIRRLAAPDPAAPLPTAPTGRTGSASARTPGGAPE